MAPGKQGNIRTGQYTNTNAGDGQHMLYPEITDVTPRLTEGSDEGEEGGGTIDNGTKTVVVATGVQALQPEGLPGHHFIEREREWILRSAHGRLHPSSSPLQYLKEKQWNAPKTMHREMSDKQTNNTHVQRIANTNESS